MQDIFDHCEKSLGKIKIYDKILESKDLIMKNYKMMQLSSPNLSFQAINGPQGIKEAIENMEFEFQKTAVVAMTIQDGFPTVSLDDLYVLMKRYVIQEKV